MTLSANSVQLAAGGVSETSVVDRSWSSVLTGLQNVQSGGRGGQDDLVFYSLTDGDERHVAAPH